MATTFEFTLSCERSEVLRAKRVLDDAQKRVAELETELSEFLPESPVHQLNRSKAFVEVSAPTSLLEVLAIAERVRCETEGAFDCTFRSQGCELEPSKRVFWDRERGVVWKAHDQVHIGFGAIGKGYALDSVSVGIEQAGFENYLLSAGGSSIVMSGYYCQGRPWQWGWSWLRDSEGTSLGLRFQHVLGRRIGIGVSGTHEQGRHIVDPKGEALSDGLKSALVARASCAEADAFSTAVFVSNEARKEKVQVPVAWIDGEGRANWNQAFQSLWGTIGVILIALLGPISAWAEDDAVDLSAMGGDSFTPYIFERSLWWIALPALMAAAVLLHLMKVKHAKRQGSQAHEKP